MPPSVGLSPPLSAAAPSHGAIFLAASSGGMRCRPYNYGRLLSLSRRHLMALSVAWRASCGRHEMPPLQLRGGCCLRSGAISWRCPFLGGLFGRHEMPPLHGAAVVFVAAPSHGAVFLAASAGGMRCRPYNCGEAVVFVRQSRACLMALSVSWRLLQVA